MNISIDNTIGEIVAEDYRTASVFQSHGIDFCCKGFKTINEVCKTKNIKPKELINELEECLENKKNGTSIDFQSWPLDLLIDYIEKKHHRYVEERMPQINQFLNKLVSVHGTNHPELFEIRDQFYKSSQELAVHMKKEELVLFPFVKKMVSNDKVDSPHFGTVENPIQMMLTEHDNEGERYRLIRKLSDNYKPPADACRTYSVTYSLLEEFEDDLHMHIHLENNILFPKALELEKEKIN